MPQHPGYQIAALVAIWPNHLQEPLAESRSLWCDKVSDRGTWRSLQGSKNSQGLLPTTYRYMLD